MPNPCFLSFISCFLNFINQVKKTEYEVELRKALQQAIDAENGRKAGEETCKLR